MTQTTVVNLRKDTCDARIDRTTIFGNPFPEWKFGRGDCIRRFETYFYARIERDPEFKAAVLSLQGLRLGCRCKPLACHGDVIADYLNSYDWVEKIKKEAGS